MRPRSRSALQGPGKRSGKGEQPRPPVTGDQDNRRTDYQAEHDGEEELPALPFSWYLGVEVGHDGGERCPNQDGYEAPGLCRGYAPNLVEGAFSELRLEGGLGSSSAH